ncbi:MAG: EAL domain-containing protein [Acidimicrobiia bacterium]|nr:EAL domain-containing protein [Acidimicrobiia bacterium]
MINLATDMLPLAGRTSMPPAEAPGAGAPSDADLRSAIRAAIGGTGLTMQFQPIFQLGNWLVGDRSPVGYEALARFELPVPTNVWFQEAVRMGFGVELELAALRVAVSHLDDIPQDCFLTVNVSPQAVESLPFWNVFSSLSSGRIRVEISEEAIIDDYEQFRTTLLGLQRRGLRVWIDDVGAGLASLKHLILLPHDTIKLDIDVVRDVDRDPNRQAMVTALVALAKASQTNVVAEGIETAAELVTLVDLGVAYGQGYYMARPAPLGEPSP